MTPHLIARLLSGAALGLSAVHGIIRGCAYLPRLSPEPLPGALALLTERTPLIVLAVLWIVSGVLCAVGMVWGQQLRFMWFAASMAAVWSVAYALVYVRGLTDANIPASREYLSSLTFLLIAGLQVITIIALEQARHSLVTADD